NGIYVAGDRENVYPARFAEYVARLDPPWMTTMRVALARTDKVLPQGEFFVGLGSANLRLLDLLGVRFLVEGPGPRGLETVAPDFRLAYEKDDVRVWENPTALPRAFVVGTAEVAPHADQVLDRLTSPEFDPASTVLLEEEPPGWRPGSSPRFSIPATLTTYSSGRVVVDV